MKLCFSILIIALFSSCSSWKSKLGMTNEQNEAVFIAVQDFLHTSKLSKQDTVFSVHIESLNDQILGISIVGTTDRLYPTPENKIGTNKKYFPTRYFEENNKLFIWYDSIYYITDELVNKLSMYNRIDSINVNGIIELRGSIDDSKKGVDYYICKNNILRYKKITTRTAMGWYKPPKVICFD